MSDLGSKWRFARLSDGSKGNWLGTLGAFGAAAFMIPYKQAGVFGEAPVVAFGLLLAAAVQSTALRWSTLVPKEVVQHRSASPVEWVSALVFAGLAIAGNTCSALALAELGPATVSVVLRTEVLAVGALGWVFLGERPSRSFWLGALLALIGLAVLSSAKGGLLVRPSVAYGLLGALCFSAMHVVARRVAHRVDLARVNMRRLWLSVALLAGWHGVLQAALQLEPMFWVWVGLAAVCGPVLSRLLLMYSVRHVPASQTALVMLSSPVFALVLGLALLGAVPSSREVVGGAIMLMGIGVPLVGHRRAVASATSETSE